MRLARLFVASIAAGDAIGFAQAGGVAGWSIAAAFAAATFAVCWSGWE